MLEVDYHNEPAIALYQQLGFEQLAARENYYGPGRHALILKLYDLAALERGGERMTAVSGPLILGIESSCDETGVGHRPRARRCWPTRSPPASAEHVRFGGVVPEVASRAHLEAMVPTLRRACAAADIDLTELDGIAVTAGPGLMGALVVGLAAAKALAYALDKPLYAVNHLAGHVAVDLLEHGPLPTPCIALLVSGGHTSLLQIADVADQHHRARARPSTTRPARRTTRWPGCWACPIPGGPHIDRRGHRRSGAVGFPRGLTAPKDLERHRFDFSFSGLKTAVARWVETRGSATAPDCRWPTWRRASRRRSATC